MDLTIPAELLELKRTVQDFVEREVDPAAEEIEDQDRVPARILQAAAELGLFGLGVPEDYGGLGLGTFGRTLVLEVLGRTVAGFAAIIATHCGIGSLGIVELGNDALRARLLPRLARGELIAGFALSEAAAGSDAAQIQTAAVRRGDHWILNGAKHFITNGVEGHIFTVIAVTDRSRGTHGMSAFVVERGFTGFRVGRVDQKMGLHGSSTAELVFEDCKVPAENLLGAEGRGYVAALKILTKGRIGLAARCAGMSQKLVELSVQYAKKRRTMGKPIIEHQMVQSMLAEMAAETDAARALVYQVALMADDDRPVIRESAEAKLFASEVLGRVADKAVQIHGGMGYMREMAVERFYRDARITRIYEGTSEIQKMIISRALAEA